MAQSRRPERPRRPEGLTGYQWRIYRRTGLLPSEARARGISLAAARGHKPQGGIPEHRLRVLRRYARGKLSEREEAFVRQQAAKSRQFTEAELRERFLSKTPDARAEIIALQRLAARRRRQSTGRRVGRRFTGSFEFHDLGVGPFPEDEIEAVFLYYNDGGSR